MTTARVTWEEPGGHIEKASHFFGTTQSNDMGNVKNLRDGRVLFEEGLNAFDGIW